MLTYQDFLAVEDNPKELASFIYEVIADHESSKQFKTGQTAGEFYRQYDRYMDNLKKVIYDIEGNAKEDTFTPNRKNTANWYFIFVTQMVSYLLGNGISFDNPEIKKKLGGNKLDSILQKCFIWSVNDGESYAVKINDTIEPLCFGSDNRKPRFAVLLDENTSEIGAGVKYWQLSPDSPRIAVLYTGKGKIRFKEFDDENSETKKSFQQIGDIEPYSGISVSNQIQGEYIFESDEFQKPPIVKLEFINGLSHIEGKIDTLINYDLTFSNMLNDVNNNVVYWIIQNAAAMDDEDDMKFLAHILRMKMAHVEDGQSVEPHQLNIQYQAQEAALMQLEQRLITDFQAIDTKSLRSGAITTVEIDQAYEALSHKCDMVENLLGDFVRGILRLYGIDENEAFHFTRSKSINISEMVGNYANTAPLTGEKYATKKILETYGDIDEFENVQNQKADDETAIFNDDRQENTIARIAEMIFQKLKQSFTEWFKRLGWFKKTDSEINENEELEMNGDDENA